MAKPPPDPEGMNDKRAQWARKALAEFKALTRVDDGDAIGDLINGLAHLADRDKAYGSVYRQWYRAMHHYREETEDKGMQFGA